MLTELPRWATTNDESVYREVADYREMSPAERARVLMAACDAAAGLLAARSDAAEVLAFRDPVPASTRRALDQLRRAIRPA